MSTAHRDGPQSSPDAEGAVDEGRVADATLEQFIVQMHAAGDPGAGGRSLGRGRVVGWQLDYDPASGGGGNRVVIGVDGRIHTRRDQRSDRVRTISASEFLFETPSPIEARYRLLAFEYGLREIMRVHNVHDQS
jgi:hypothetical protein